MTEVTPIHLGCPKFWCSISLVVESRKMNGPAVSLLYALRCVSLLYGNMDDAYLIFPFAKLRILIARLAPNIMSLVIYTTACTCPSTANIEMGVNRKIKIKEFWVDVSLSNTPVNS